MSEGTPPRLTSAFPQSPHPNSLRRRGESSGSGPSSLRNQHPGGRNLTAKLRPDQSLRPRNDNVVKSIPSIPPLIPFDIIDAPTQRMYAVAFYICLLGWKLVDWTRLYNDDGDMGELWFALKWIAIDGVFFSVLPSFRIPWLTLNQFYTLAAIALMSTINILLSLKFVFHLSSLTAIFWKIFYDRDLAISERSVKWHDIVHNNSHIMGKYTVHILPEGAAKLNPDKIAYCVGPGRPSVTIPIRINGTEPVYMQLLRIDPETAVPEAYDLNKKQLKKLFKAASRDDQSELRHLPFVVTKPGLYFLAKVKDITELDVRVQDSEAIVAACPKASITARVPKRSSDMCKGDLADLTLSVEGLAPLQVTYTRNIGGKPTTFNVQRVHPENFESPLLGGYNREIPLLRQDDSENFNWVGSKTITIGLNDTLNSHGDWEYEIEKVIDAVGNEVYYNRPDEESWTPKQHSVSHHIQVHERPTIRFLGCDSQNPLHLPRGKSRALPFELRGVSTDAPFKMQFDFTRFDKLASATEHSPDYETRSKNLKDPIELVIIRDPGLYTVRSISSIYCSGDVHEPASCLVTTPAEPTMTMEFNEILDKCTSSSIGLTVDLTLVGSPPFQLSYRLIKDGGPPQIKTLKIDKTRHQVRFTPEESGHYAYEFFRLDDVNYVNIKLNSSELRAEQTVKPLAGATFVDTTLRKSCIQEPVEFELKMQGSGPLTLHYDLIHRGKRTRYTDKDITSPFHTIRTKELDEGGEWAVALISVEDQSGCKVALDSEAKIKVRFQRPKAQFGQVEGKFSVQALEGKTVDIPMRLTGEGPWSVRVKNLNNDGPARELNLRDSNTYFQTSEVGTYQLESVRDSGCPGTVLDAQSQFTIEWLPRPQVHLPQSASIKTEGGISHRTDICEGDEDTVEIAMIGTPPFIVDYEQRFKPEGGRSFEKNSRSVTAGLGVATIRLDSAAPGLYQYHFNQVADSVYDNPKDKNIRTPVVLEQRVFPKPNAAFVNANRVYKYCLDSAPLEDSSIPMHLTGAPPFSITIGIKHLSTGRVDLIQVPNIDTHHYKFQVPSYALTLGDHLVSVGKVKDARGCTRKITNGPHVRLQVADMPTITPIDQRNDYCVGERIAFNLAGVPQFAVEYEWNGVLMKATSQPSQFVRVAERPGNFTITGIQDSASDCKVNLSITKIIHEVPSVRISEGFAVVKGIPQGDMAEIEFRFFGTPPFTFTYTRSEIVKKGQKARILEMHSQTSEDHTYILHASQEGTYEVISIEDRYCSYAASVNGRKS